ncbi:MAG: diguanylate cyclase [Candidatus Nanopelagicales bacterium]
MRAEVAIRSLLDAFADPVVLLAPVRDDQGRVVDFEYVEANAAACAFEGIQHERFLGSRMLQMHPGNLEAGTFDSYVRVLETGEPFSLDDAVYTLEASGHVRVFDVRAVRADGLVTLTWRDVTARHERVRLLAESEERYRLLAENSSDVVMRSRDNHVVWVSPSLERMLGWTPEEWIGHSLAEFGHQEDYPVVQDALQRMDAGESIVMRVRVVDKTGTLHWVELHARTYLDASGTPNGVLSSFRTVDEEVAAAAALERLARFDALTGLLNRHEAFRVIQAAGSRRRRPGDQLAVLFCDVDRFKDINDEHGHAAGDAVLREFALRISETVRRDDLVARFGGDEFVVLLEGVHDLAEVVGIAEKIRVAASRPVRHDGMAISSSVSIGAALAPPGGDTEQLLNRADTAMYEAKRAGRNRVVAIDDRHTPAGLDVDPDRPSS